MQLLLLNILMALLLILGGAVIPASAAPARLSGDVTLGMAGYRAEEAGVEMEKISSMQQQYTLTVDKSDTLGDARLGSYTLLLGYEFNVLDAEHFAQGVRDPAIGKVDAGKLYYNANLTLAPGGLPFRLSLFAQDLSRSTTVGRNFGNRRLGNQGQERFAGHLVDAEVPVDLLNGTTRVFGATLLIGIRNGSYLGQYRDFLSQLPRVLIDFKQVDGEDLHSIYGREHYRFRDLAFVSLNKKDNWVHLRLREYTDYLNPGKDEQRAQVMIGSIDHSLNRQWINLTNWIKISGDLSYTVENQSYWQDPKLTYAINLFAVGSSKAVKGSVLSSYDRENDGNYVTSTAELPVTVNFERDRDTLIRTRFITDAKQQTPLDGFTFAPGEDVGREEYADNSFYLDVNSELRRTRQVIVKPRVEMETRNAADRSGAALRLGGELTSNSVGRKGMSWLTGYFLATTQGEDETARSNYLQHDLYGRVDKDINSTLRVGGRSSLTFGSGEQRTGLAFRIPTMSRSSVRSVSVDDDGSSGTMTKGDFDLYLDHRYRQMGNRFELDYNFVTGVGAPIKKSALRHSLSYRQLTHRLDWDSEIAFGDEIASPPTVGLEFVAENSSANEMENRSSWFSRATYRYDPSRSGALTLIGAISEGQTLSYTLSEEIVYRIFTTNGIVRRLAEFSELIRYERASEAAENRDSSLYGLFSAAYLPTKYMQCRVSSEIVSFLGSGALQQTNSAEVSFGFEKLKLLASYSQGHKDRESVDLPEVKEERWDLKVKKIF